MLEVAIQREQQIKKTSLAAAAASLKKAQDEVRALEDALVKSLTGESGLDVEFVNQAIKTRREMLSAAETDHARVKAELENEKGLIAHQSEEVQQIKQWAEVFDDASPESKKMILSKLIERIEVGRDYEITIRFNLTARQFMGEVA